MMIHLSNAAPGTSAWATPGSHADIAEEVFGRREEWPRVAEALRTLQRLRLIYKHQTGSALRLHLCGWVECDRCHGDGGFR
ncbi:hypothetical protein F0U44_02805 [Nocardioides humilatus]|uniref:Uncharacterized protein n=1 Tax=Nocardioides humilatus TaxID=2607660 RepID=A0A5B1LNN7_9ACTN|nr:hypothetical protein [Nocardioides humilatus]KAA1421259.1 hypothetical protein F0U44_02805 [Nocardioides humilatus]